MKIEDVSYVMKKVADQNNYSNMYFLVLESDNSANWSPTGVSTLLIIKTDNKM